MTDEEKARMYYEMLIASQAEKADASRKLRTVYDILAVLEREGALEVSTELVRALLQPTKEALGEAEEKTDLGEAEHEKKHAEAEAFLTEIDQVNENIKRGGR